MRYLPAIPGFLVVLAAVFNFVHPMNAQQEANAKFYELRIYYANEGKLDDLHARFRDHTMRIFQHHGMVNLGYWVPLDNLENKLIYLLGFESEEARNKAWKEFGQDPAWQKVYKDSTASGRLVKKVDSIFLKPTDYSPPIQVVQSSQPHIFELRTYKTPVGKLDNLHARFRNTTIDLFTVHGMEHFGYWMPTKESDGAGNTLIYILFHESVEARNKSFADFRSDERWLSAKNESEKGGSLTTSVESVLMKPTDYSPSR